LAILASGLGIVTCNGEPTGPEDSLAGLWGGRYALVYNTDTFTLALTQEGSEVQGFGVLHPYDDLTRFYDIFSVTGAMDSGLVQLSMLAEGRPSPPYHLTGAAERGVLSGTVNFSAEERPITLRLFQPEPDDAAGTWILSSRSGPPEEEARSIQDTIIVNPNGCARRRRGELGGSGYATPAMWSRRSEWLVLVQWIGWLRTAEFPLLDSLRLEAGTLVRLVPGIGGSTVEERFVRVSPPG
jgi:hypothetical protein